MSVNKVIYLESWSAVPWTRVYGDELLNFICVYDPRLSNHAASWKNGERRTVVKDVLDKALACFPLDYTVEYA